VEIEFPKKSFKLKKIYLKNHIRRGEDEKWEIIILLNKRISWQVICKSNKVNDGKANVSEWERVSEREREKKNERN
jgi:hypothetical protein